MKILLIAVNPSTFVLRDYQILKTKYDTTLYIYNNRSFKTLLNLIKEHHLFIFWFASIRFFLPTILAKLFNKKIVTIAGGYDVSKVESGSMQSIWKSIIVNFILNQSNRVIAISKSSLNEIKMNCRINFKKVNMIYHGFAPVNNINLTQKRNIILTIGYIDDLSFTRKGIDRFFDLADRMPDIEFHFIGTLTLKNIIKEVPTNIIQHGQLKTTDDKFIKLLNETKVYFQLSKHESFGCSVAEAMQYGCVPIITNYYSLPEVVGDCGMIISDLDNLEEIKNKVLYIFNNYNESWGNKCINRIKDTFNLNERSTQMLKIVSELL